MGVFEGARLIEMGPRFLMWLYTWMTCFGTHIWCQTWKTNKLNDICWLIYKVSISCLYNWFSRTASLFNQTKFIEWCSFGGSPTPHLQLDLKQAVTMLKIISCKDLSKFQNSSFHFLSWTELWIKVTHLKRPGGSWPKHGTRYVPCHGKPYEFSRNVDPFIYLNNANKMLDLVRCLMTFMSNVQWTEIL